jgi:hypothetical protein
MAKRGSWFNSMMELLLLPGSGVWKSIDLTAMPDRQCGNLCGTQAMNRGWFIVDFIFIIGYGAQ